MMYQYKESGLDNIWLVNGFHMHETPYGKGVSIDNADELHQVIGYSIVNGSAKIRPEEFRFLRVQLGLSQKALGELMGVDQQSIARWEKGRTKEGIPGPAEKLIRIVYLEFLNQEPHVLQICENLADLDERDFAKKRKFEDYNGDWRLAA